MDPFKYIIFSQLGIIICVKNSRLYFRELFQTRGAQVFQRSRSHLRIVGTRVGDVKQDHH
jgi:hypothetical protein